MIMNKDQKTGSLAFLRSRVTVSYGSAFRILDAGRNGPSAPRGSTISFSRYEDYQVAGSLEIKDKMTDSRYPSKYVYPSF
jgi:hypothetical protein